jgi:hypothetical protein
VGDVALAVVGARDGALEVVLTTSRTEDPSDVVGFDGADVDVVVVTVPPPQQGGVLP